MRLFIAAAAALIVLMPVSGFAQTDATSQPPPTAQPAAPAAAMPPATATTAPQNAAPQSAPAQSASAQSASAQPAKPVACEYAAHEGELIPLNQCVSQEEANRRRLEQQRQLQDFQLRSLETSPH